MKLTSPFLPLRNLTVFATAGLLALSTASATLRTYEAKWSGAVVPLTPNSVEAVAEIVIDDQYLLNPGISDKLFSDPTRAVVSVRMVVTGSSYPIANGVFTTEDFGQFVLKIETPLDLESDWIGQAQPGGVWGTGTNPNRDFNLYGIWPAPSAVIGGGGNFTLNSPNEAHGNQMKLVSFRPILGEIILGEPIANVPDATLVAMSPPAMASDKSLYMRGTIKGVGVTSANNACLLEWNRVNASVLVRKGDSLAGAPILSFGDPIVDGTNVFFMAKLLSGGSVTAANDQVLARVHRNGTGLAVIAREGDPAAGVAGFNHFKVLWTQPVTNGLFFGAVIVDAIDPKIKKTGIWLNNGTTSTLKAITGGTVDVRFVPKEIKIIGRPTATSPMNTVTRAGNAGEIAVAIKTTDNITILKTFRP